MGDKRFHQLSHWNLSSSYQNIDDNRCTKKRSNGIERNDSPI